MFQVALIENKFRHMKIKLLLCLVLLFAVRFVSLAQVTVNGSVNLEGQLNHANVKVKFIAESPSAVTDSVYTNALGEYSHQLVSGVYTIQYEKSGYQTYPAFPDLSIIEDFDAGLSQLYSLGQTVPAGGVKGVWSGIVTVSGNITVANGDTLLVEKGTKVRFLGGYSFIVNGLLLVKGTETEKVVFRSMPANQALARGQWKGITIEQDANANCMLTNAKISNAVNGIYVNRKKISLKNCEIFNNSEYGVYTYYTNSSLVMDSCLLHHNTQDGLYAYITSVTVKNSKAYSNRYGFNYSSATGSMESSSSSNNSSYGVNVASSTMTFDRDSVYGNANRGFNTSSSNLTIKNSVLINNGNDGIYSNSDSKLDVINCEIVGNVNQGIYVRYVSAGRLYANNLSHNTGNGIYFYRNSNINVEKNIIAYNGTKGINIGSTGNKPVIMHNTIYGNVSDGIYVGTTSTEKISSNAIVANGGYGLNNVSPVETMLYNDFYENVSGAIADTTLTPDDTWKFISTNENGLLADIYLNIEADPQFILADEYDFTLKNTSPLINAGDRGITDPDGTISDIGALYRDAGNPHALEALSFLDKGVELEWTASNNDSVLSYNIYYKESGTADFVLYGNTEQTKTVVNGLTNGVNYDFTLTGVYPAYESVYTPQVSEMPGVPEMLLDPVAMNITIPFAADTIFDTLTVTNSGSRDLEFNFPHFTQKKMNALALDGNGDYIRIPDNNKLDGMNELTIELWYNKQQTGSFDLVDKHYYSYGLSISSDQIRFNKSSGTTYASYLSNVTVPSGWHHLAVSWKASSVRFYLDGKLVKTITGVSTTPIANRADQLYIGSGRYHGGSAKGNISEVKIWNRERSESEIVSDMHAVLTEPVAGLVGYWPLDADLEDFSGNNANGTAVGNAKIAPVGTYEKFVKMDTTQFVVLPGESMKIGMIFPNAYSGTLALTSPIETNENGYAKQDYEFSVTYGEKVVSTPVHFSPVAETGMPYTIVITDAILDGKTINIGDEIGVFDGDVCVGAGVFDGSFNFVVTAWEGDPANSLDGFTSGNPVRFKVFDTSADLEAVTDAHYSIGDGTFGYGQFSALSLISTVYSTQTIEIEGGKFNLISFNLLPRYNDAKTAFSSIADLEIAYNDRGNAFIPAYDINTVGDIDFRDGYHLFANADATVSFEGTPVNPSKWNITLEAGKWNSISYLSQNPADITLAFPAAIHDQIDIVQTSSGLVWIPSMDVNTIGNMQPGMGYQVAIRATDDIDFAYNLMKSDTEESEDGKTEPKYFSFTETGLVYFVAIDCAELGLETGDELAVFDNDLCVGAAVYSGGDVIAVPAWQALPEQGIDGFAEGSTIGVKIYKTASGGVLNVSFDTESVFNKGNYAYLKAGSAVTSTNDVNLSLLVSPNPFTEKVVVSVIGADKIESCMVTNALGGLVTELAPSSKMTWCPTDADVAGLYYIEVTVAGKTVHTPVLLNK